MSDEVYQAIGHASSGFVEPPAGCGKTEAIVRTVASFCNGPQLILTHTHAGVAALRQRFQEHHVPSTKYHVDTIAGWAWSWVRKYPDNAAYRQSIDIPVWNDVYVGMSNLLLTNFVRQGIENSYAGIIVDEYQDCTIPMHQLIVQLKGLLPCRVLGDDLQGIFGFREDRLVDWSDVKAEFVDDLGALGTPHRWIKANNARLGQWLLRTRSAFRQNREPNYGGSPIDRRTISYRNLGPQLIRLTHEKQGRICVIGPKMRRLNSAIETALVNQNYRLLEPNELSALQELSVGLSDGLPHNRSKAATKFLTRTHGGLSGDEKSFLGKILKGQHQRPAREDRRRLCEKHTEGMTPQLLLELLQYVKDLPGVVCKLTESVSALKCILEKHEQSGGALKALYADEIAKRKHQIRSNTYRCVGSTLLVKGLEFDHVVIVRGADWESSWGNHKDLYVALTRGSQSVILIELSN